MNRYRKARQARQLLLGLALSAILVTFTGGIFYVQLQTYQHHNPGNTVQDFLYGERRDAS